MTLQECRIRRYLDFGPDSKVQEGATKEHARHYGFLLLHGFSELGLACATEALRLANVHVGREVYCWKRYSENGVTAQCSNGMTVLVDSGLDVLRRGTTLIAVGGPGVSGNFSDPLLSYLRREHLHGTRLGAIGSGCFCLARAGFLDGLECAISWHEYDAFSEMFPNAQPSRKVFVAGPILTAADGIAAADLFLHVIAGDLGPVLSARVADYMLYSGLRGSQSAQRISPQSRFGVRDPVIAGVLHLMEENVETPLSISEISARVGLSTRQIERTFNRYVSDSPMAYYRRLRLEKARTLLLMTEMSIVEIAIACGFETPSHFSRTYKKFFGQPPNKQRVFC